MVGIMRMLLIIVVGQLTGEALYVSLFVQRNHGIRCARSRTGRDCDALPAQSQVWPERPGLLRSLLQEHSGVRGTRCKRTPTPHPSYYSPIAPLHPDRQLIRPSSVSTKQRANSSQDSTRQNWLERYSIPAIEVRKSELVRSWRGNPFDEGCDFRHAPP